MKIRTSFALLALCASAIAEAGGTWTNVTVTQLVAYGPPNGYVQVQLSAPSTGGPNCAATYKNWVAIDTTTAAGAFAATVFQSARLLGTVLNIAGTGSCNITNTIETLAYVQE